MAIAVEVRPAAGGSSRPRARTRRSCSSTTASTSAGSSRCWRAPTRCTSPRRSSRASCTTSSPARSSDEKARRELESRAAGTKALGTWHATRTIQECREACGGAGYLSVNRFAALKADTDVFTTFEGDNHGAPAAGRQGAAHRLLQRVRGPRPVRHGPVRRRPRRRDGAREGRRPQAARADQGRAARRRRGLGPGGRAAGPGVPARHVPLPRGAHARRRRPAAEARHRQEDEPRRGLLPGPGPRDRRGPGPHGAAGARGVRRRRRGRCPTATSRSRSTCSATCMRCPASRPTARGSWSTAGSPRSAARRSPARSADLCRKIRPIAGDLVDGFGVPVAMLRAPDLVR